VLTRDERCAAYMADAYARVTGRVGVCEGPSGGGATYIAPGVVEANESSVPVLSITRDVSVTSLGRYPLTELRQEELFRPLTKWNGVIDHPQRLANMVRAAFRAMSTGRPGAAHLGFPIDVQRAPVDGVPFPHTLRIETAAETRAEVALKDVELNPALPPGLFRLRHPADRGHPGARPPGS